MKLEKNLKTLPTEIARRIDSIIKKEHYSLAKVWVEELEKRNYDVSYYQGVLKDGRITP